MGLFNSAIPYGQGLRAVLFGRARGSKVSGLKQRTGPLLTRVNVSSKPPSPVSYACFAPETAPQTDRPQEPPAPVQQPPPQSMAAFPPQPPQMMPQSRPAPQIGMPTMPSSLQQQQQALQQQLQANPHVMKMLMHPQMQSNFHTRVAQMAQASAAQGRPMNQDQQQSAFLELQLQAVAQLSSRPQQQSFPPPSQPMSHPGW